MPPIDSTLLQRFWSKVNKDGPIVRPELGPCWIWTGQINNKGYGVWNWPRGFCMKTRQIYAHRFSWWAENGNPESLHVCHKCDNPPCCNTSHLFAGEATDNSMDMAAKLRGNTTKLTHEQIATIRGIIRGHQSYGLTKQLCEAYGVHRSTIRRVAKSETFKLL